MEDSLELPGSDEEFNEINFAISPNVSHQKKQQKLLRKIGSQESLSYSNQTNTKYLSMERSPIHINMPSFQSSQKTQDLKQMLEAGKQTTPLSAKYKMSKKSKRKKTIEEESSIREESPRKTVDKNNMIDLNRKIKELEYALQLEIVVSEELRTKVGVLSGLLEQKLKDCGLSRLLKLKNSATDLTNIDIFVQLKKNQKHLQEKSQLIQKQKEQIARISSPNLTHTFHNENQNTINTPEVELLRQEKESLFIYIEELKQEYNVKAMLCKELELELKRYEEKQNQFVNVERVKLTTELSHRGKRIGELQGEMEQLKMEANLMQMRHEAELQELQTKLSESPASNPQLQHTSTNTQSRQFTHTSSQTTTPSQLDMLYAETKLLKTERNYFQEQYKKQLQLASKAYALELEAQSLRNAYL